MKGSKGVSARLVLIVGGTQPFFHELLGLIIMQIICRRGVELRYTMFGSGS